MKGVIVSYDFWAMTVRVMNETREEKRLLSSSLLLSKYFIFVLAVLVIFTRIQSLWEPVINHDEAAYTVLTQEFIHGAKPYKDLIETKPAGLYFLWGTLYKVLGRVNLIDLHALGMIWVFLTAFFILKIGQRLNEEEIGKVAALFYVIFSTTYVPKYIATSMEIFANLYTILCIYFLARGRSWAVALAGFFASLAFLTKYQNAVIVPPALVFLLYPLLVQWKKIKIFDLCKPIFIFSLGFLIPVIAHCIYVYKIGVWDEFLYWSLKGSFLYASPTHESTFHLLRVLTRVAAYLAYNAPLWFLAFYSLKKKNFSSTRLLVFAWAGVVCAIPAIFIGWRLYDHYFIQWLPSLVFLGAYGWSTLQVQKPEWSSKILWAIAIIFLVSWLPRFDLNLVNQVSGDDNAYDYYPIIEEVKNRTQPGDRIFIWGMAPHVYLFSGTRPASGFCSLPHPLTGVGLGTPMSNQIIRQYDAIAWNQFRGHLNQYKPVYILDMAPSNLHDWGHSPIEAIPPLQEILKQNYILQGNFHRVDFYRRKEIWHPLIVE